MKRISWIYLVGLVGLIAVGMLTIHSGAIAVAEESSQTESERIPVVPSRVLSAAERALVAGNTQFAFDLYRNCSEPLKLDTLGQELIHTLAPT